MIKYLSPSSLSLWKRDPEAYFMKYLAEHRLPREPQTIPMALGSSFDAYVKSFLYQEFVAKGDPRYVFETIFEAQVEPERRDVARKDGNFLFKQYRENGALAELMLEMRDSLGDPRFEFDVTGTIEFQGRSCVLLGKPDVFFRNKEGALVILDFKVNGFYSNSRTSPKKGYIRLFPGYKSHKDAFVQRWNGLNINVAQGFEHCDEDWATQISIYAWLCGCDVGSSWLGAIEQVLGRPDEVRFAQHRGLVSAPYQAQVFNAACDAWEAIQSGHIFQKLSRSDSDARCNVLNNVASRMPNDPHLRATLR